MLWDRAEATLVDQRFLKQGAYQSDGGGRTSYQVWEYMLDIPAPDGSSVRLTTKEKSFWLPNGVETGDPLPVLINKKRTRVQIDRKAISDHSDSVREGREKVQKARDEARFKAKMEGRSEEDAARAGRQAEDQALGDPDVPGAAAAEIRKDIEIDRELEDQMREDEEFLRKHSKD